MIHWRWQMFKEEAMIKPKYRQPLSLCITRHPCCNYHSPSLSGSLALSLPLSLIHLLRSLHSHYILSWLLWTDSVDDFCCQAGLNGHRHTRAASLSFPLSLHWCSPRLFCGLPPLPSFLPSFPSDFIQPADSLSLKSPHNFSFTLWCKLSSFLDE